LRSNLSFTILPYQFEKFFYMRHVDGEIGFEHQQALSDRRRLVIAPARAPEEMVMLYRSSAGQPSLKNQTSPAPPLSWVFPSQR